jgi:hypothetical protein
MADDARDLRNEARQAAAEARAAAAEVRRERVLALKARIAAALAAQGLTAQVASAQWDPAGDDPDAFHDDGRRHPDEDAIADRAASHAAKADAWENRAMRLNDEGKVIAAQKALTHSSHHAAHIGEDSP